MPRTKIESQQAGHYEIHGETIAKFEFFDHGYNPYSRYLDIDKVDLILRKRIGNQTRYVEVQVKYGRLYICDKKWMLGNHFEHTSWRFFKLDEFTDTDSSLFVAYVLAHPDGYKGDIFIFPVKIFHGLLQKAIISNTKKGKKANVFIAHCSKDNKWYLWRKRKFTGITEENVMDVTEYYRNFSIIDSSIK